jgi:hypothetical protein
VASFEERIYELGSEALAEQERQVAEVRGRGATLLAAGALIASLLAKPVFDGDHPHGFVEIAATAIGLLGCSAVLVFVVLLLRRTLTLVALVLETAGLATAAALAS